MVTHWISAIRPKTLGAASAPILLGATLASLNSSLNLVILSSILGSALCIQIGTNLANDYFDHIKGADTPYRLGPQRVTQSGLIPPKTVKNAFILCFMTAFLIGLYLISIGGWPIALIGCLAILFGILYTATPYALAYTGLADIIALLFFGPIAVGGTSYLLTQEWQLDSLILGLSPGLLSVTLLGINNLRDRHEDKLSQKNTLIVRYGERFGRFEIMGSLGLAMLVPLIWAHPSQHWGILIGSLCPIIIAITIGIQALKLDGKQLNTLLAKTGALLIIHSLCLCLGLWVYRV